MKAVHYVLALALALCLCVQISDGNWGWVVFDSVMAPLLLLTAPAQ